jgi:KaiC/GvpD/RAD55 family RecA-like ATPase
LNLASALFKRILEEEDFDTWAGLKKHYLPGEYQVIYEVIDKHIDQYHALPSIEELKLAVRDGPTLDKIYAIEAVSVDAEPFLLLDYLKNEFTQQETLSHLQRYVEHSISFETAQETIDSLYDIISNIESRVDLTSDEDSLQKMNLFESDEELADYIPLGLNAEFDDLVRFKQTDYILMGGRRGSGKSITCSNLANTVYSRGKSVLYFSIEMPLREILQRQASIGAQIPHSKIKYKTLNNYEWMKLAEWWAKRYKNGETHLAAYAEHRSFDKFHKALQKEELSDVQIDIIYEPSLSLPKLKAEIIKRVRKLGNVGLIIVDYVNQVRKTAEATDKFDWKDQIEVSAALKNIAGELRIPVFSPYQSDSLGEARFAKGILDSADAAFVLTAGTDSIFFECTKLRGDAMVNFTSKANWSNLTIGPENGIEIEVEDKSHSKGKSFSKKQPEDKPLMDAIYDDG